MSGGERRGVTPSNWGHVTNGAYACSCLRLVMNGLPASSIGEFCSVLSVIEAAHRFSLPDFASSHWVHSLCLDFFVCHCLVCACMFYYCNVVR